jgi:hypothetical protein
LLLELNEAGDEFSTPSSALADWIGRYDDWWKRASGVIEGRNLHLLYGRNISAFGSNILSLPRALEELLRATTRRGCSFLLRARVDECLQFRSELQEISAGGVHTIILDARDCEQSEESRAPTLSLVEELVGKKLTIALMGPIGFWKAAGVVNSPTLDATNFQLIPATQKSQVAEIVRQSKEKRLKPVAARRPEPYREPAPSGFDPCWNRFQVFVTPDGHLYPCNGLIGSASCSLGTIHDALEDTGLGGEGRHPLALDELAVRGPRLPAAAALSEYSDLPLVCANHRRDIETRL